MPRLSAPPELRAEWERLLTIMPEAVKAAVTPELWDRDRLHALDVPVRDVAIDGLAWLLDVPLWAVEGAPFRVTPNEVRAAPEAFPGQHARTMAADLAWPIHIMRFRGRWIILDGVHRLLKAEMLGRERIPGMVLSRSDYASIVYAPERRGSLPDEDSRKET